MSTPKKHHYHPQFLLKEFCADKNSKLFAYDLQGNQIGLQSPKEVACESNFYGKDSDLENEFADVELKARDAIVKFKNGEILSNQEKINFAIFIALMGIRTPAFLDNLGQLRVCYEQAKLYQEGQDFAFTLTRTAEISRDIILQDPVLAHYWRFLFNNILKMKWSLFKAPDGKRFITSDNPVCSMAVVQNDVNIYDEFSNPSLSLYLPLSKECCWVGSFKADWNKIGCPEDDRVGTYIATDSGMDMFERYCVKYAKNYLYASTKDESILAHAMRYYGISPFERDVTNLPPDYISPSTTVKRVKS